MNSLLLLFMLLQFPPIPAANQTAGIELNPYDPGGNNYDLLSKCTQKYTYCVAYYTPGTYYLKKPISIPPFVTHAYFTNVRLIPCAAMDSVIKLADPLSGIIPQTQLHDLYVDYYFMPCGTFVPPLKAWTSFAFAPKPPPPPPPAPGPKPNTIYEVSSSKRVS